MTTLDLPIDSVDAFPDAAARRVGRAARRVALRALWITANRVAAITIVLAIGYFALNLGLRWRAEMWEFTRPVRFQGDIANGFNWGRMVNDRAEALACTRDPQHAGAATLRDVIDAWIRTYPDELVRQTPGAWRGGLDYPPLRLLTMALWVNHVRAIEPGAAGWRDELSTPMLIVNTAFGLAAMAGAFLLVHYWAWRASAHHRSRADPLAWRPMLCGLGAATLLWLNLAVLVNAHAWPQWDTWLLPFYLWAAYLISINRGLPAGVVAGLGVLFKGQMLLVLPLLVLWPRGAWRRRCGFSPGCCSYSAQWCRLGWCGTTSRRCTSGQSCWRD